MPVRDKTKQKLDAIKLCSLPSSTCHWQLLTANSENSKSNHLSKWKQILREWIFLSYKQKAQLYTDKKNEDVKYVVLMAGSISYVCIQDYNIKQSFSWYLYMC